MVYLIHKGKEEMLVHIENQNIYFFGQEKRVLFDKIKQRLDE
jgi:hypothetical protein